MDIAEVGQIILRLAHGLAAALWVGGGAYYVLAVRPKIRDMNDAKVRELGVSVQREFGEWASVASLVMIASGVVLMFDRLSGGQGSAGYVLLLAAKIVAALVAFWMTGALRIAAGGRRKRRSGYLDTAWVALGLSAFAFVVGALLTSLYPAAIDW